VLRTVIPSDFQHWSEASHAWAAIHQAFLNAQREYDLAFDAVRRGDPAAKATLVAAAVRLRQAQVELMHFVRHQQPRSRPNPDR
jgi:hypothetical protein